jgi:hypothetical protein
MFFYYAHNLFPVADNPVTPAAAVKQCKWPPVQNALAANPVVKATLKALNGLKPYGFCPKDPVYCSHTTQER